METLGENGGLKKRGQKIKKIKLEKIDSDGNNGYDRAAKNMSKTKKRQYQQLQIENADGATNRFLFFLSMKSMI